MSPVAYLIAVATDKPPIWGGIVVIIAMVALVIWWLAQGYTRSRRHGPGRFERSAPPAPSVPTADHTDERQALEPDASHTTDPE